LVGQLAVSADGRTVSGRFQCGGRLRAKESGHTVTITYVASAVRSGAMSCAMVALKVRLATPLGSRRVVDGVSGQPLHLRR
jgi:hypothetical protein